MVGHGRGRWSWPSVVGHRRQFVGHGRDCDHHAPGRGCSTPPLPPSGPLSGGPDLHGAMHNVCDLEKSFVTPANMSWVGFGRGTWLWGNRELWTCGKSM